VPYPFDLRRVKSRAALLTALGIDDGSLEAVLAFDPPPRRVADAVEASPDKIRVIDIPLFIRHDIPKRNRSQGYRTVWEPAFLKNEYKALGRRLDSFFRLCLEGYPHSCSYGYRPGRNIRENATVHAGHKFLLCMDVKSFFCSITTTRVKDLLLSLGVNPEVAELLSRFVTIGGELALGLPTSPTISNAIALPIDQELEQLAALSGASYSRYADDMSFSSNRALPNIDEVTRCIASHGFRIADAKTRMSKRGQAHYVTGLSISDDAQPHAPRKKKRILRQELYYASKFGLDEHFRHRGINDSRIIQMEVNRLDGLIKYVAHHEHRKASQLRSYWADILRDSNMKPSFAPKNQHREPFNIFVDEAEYLRDGRRVLALGMAVTQHATQVVTESREVLSAALEDLWEAGNVSAIEKRGLHFADATEDLRLAYVRRLAAMPFEGYVAYASYANSNEYEETYLRLLGALLPRRLKAAESKAADLYFEENSKVSQKSIKEAVQTVHNELRARSDRHPLVCGVGFVSKPHIATSVPDFLLGVLGKYLQSAPPSKGKPEPRERLVFERLRDKYRLILDLDSRTEYSRRNPLKPWHDD
jgi:hypothetical protein